MTWLKTNVGLIVSWFGVLLTATWVASAYASAIQNSLQGIEQRIELQNSRIQEIEALVRDDHTKLQLQDERIGRIILVQEQVTNNLRELDRITIELKTLVHKEKP